MMGRSDNRYRTFFRKGTAAKERIVDEDQVSD